MLRIRFVLFAFCLICLSLPNTAKAKVFNAQEFFLPNGLQVILIENNRAPVVAHMLWYKVGRADEEVGVSGIAHFFEHLMFKGTPTVPAGEFSKTVKRLGGRDNAFTAQDYTAYFQTVPVEHLETVMRMEADRMTNLIINPERVAVERDVIIEERKQRTDNNPGAILREEVRSALYANHPYRIPVIGWMSEIEGLETEDAKAFYERWYAPNNAILVVSGNISVDELRPIVERTYGAIVPSTLPERSFPTPAPIKTEQRLTYRDPRVGSASVSINYRAPRGNEALSVLMEAFGGTTTSPLYKSLVVDQKIAVSAGGYYGYTSKDISSIALYASPAPGVDIKVVEKALLDEVEKLMKDGLPAEDIESAKTRMIDATVFERDSLMGPAMIVGRGLTSGFTLEEIETWPERIEALTVDQVNAARSIFNTGDRPITSLLLPPKGDSNE